MNYAVEQRLRFIEATLDAFGQINRADITERFRISKPQATKDLGAYQELAPKNLNYDHRAKVYLRGDKFKHVFKQKE